MKNNHIRSISIDAKIGCKLSRRNRKREAVISNSAFRELTEKVALKPSSEQVYMTFVGRALQYKTALQAQCGDVKAKGLI